MVQTIHLGLVALGQRTFCRDWREWTKPRNSWLLRSCGPRGYATEMTSSAASSPLQPLGRPRPSGGRALTRARSWLKFGCSSMSWST